jgi:hypothetical protein
MGQCVKCAGRTVTRSRVGIGSYPYCRRCGPQYTPPYTPERMALAGMDVPIQISERDSKRVLDLLDHPPPPSAKLLRAAGS